jgi:hypothetical protein
MIEPVLDGRTSLVGQFELNGPTGLLLYDDSAISLSTSKTNIGRLQTNEIAPPQIAVDREIEHREIAAASFKLSRMRMAHTSVGRKGRFCPSSRPLFQARW